MKKLFLLLLLVMPSILYAQHFFRFGGMQYAAGTYNIGGHTVTVEHHNITNFAGITPCDGPFHFDNHDSYSRFSFSFPAREFRQDYLSFHPNDTIVVYTNGTKYDLLPANLYTNACNSTGGVIVNGILTGVGSNGRIGLQFDTKRPVDSIRFQYQNATTYSGLAWSLYFTYDSSAYITQPFSTTTYCRGDSVFIPYTVTAQHGAGNIFRIELSDASGSFAAPVTIGSLAAIGNGTLRCRIPLSTPVGSGYRIRIASTNPGFYINELPLNLSISTPLTSINATGAAQVCTGKPLNLAVAVLPAATYSYSWQGPASYTSNTQNPTVAINNANQGGNYIVTATSGTGCSLKDTVAVTVAATPPMPTLLSNIPACQGQVLTLSVTNQGGGVITYWNGPLSFTATGNTVQIPNANIAQGGLYRVSVKSTAGCSSDTLDIIATVKPLPLNPMAGSNSPVCEGGQLLLNSSSPTLGATYSWAGPNGYSSNTQNPIIDPVAANGAGNYEVTAVLNGCNSTGKGIATVVVNTVTYLGAYASPNDTVCAGTLVALVVVPVNGGATAQYQWFRNGVEIQGATNLTYNTSNYVTGDTFYCRLRSTDVCATPITIYSNKVGMMVLPTPGVPKASVLSNPQKPLPGAPVAFSVTVVNGGGQNPTYQWQRNGQNIGGAIYNNWSTNNLAPYDKINCLVSSSDPCINPATFSTDTLTINFPASINDISHQDDMVIYPNPNTGSCTLQFISKASGNAGISISNHMGQQVYKNDYELKEGNTELQFSHQLPAGIYYLQLQTVGGISYSKMTVDR